MDTPAQKERLKRFVGSIEGLCFIEASGDCLRPVQIGSTLLHLAIMYAKEHFNEYGAFHKEAGDYKEWLRNQLEGAIFAIENGIVTWENMYE